MQKEPHYRLEVVPLVVLPLGRSPYFSYVSTQSVALGSLISISFGPQTVNGVVFDCHPLPGPKPQWMKEITRVIAEGFLTPQQCLLAKAISKEYFTPLGRTLRHFLPKKVVARKKEFSKAPTEKIILRANKEEKLLIKKLALAKKETPCYIDTSLFTDTKRIFLLIGKQLAKEKKQTLILVPEITLLSSISARLETCFAPLEIAVLHSKLSLGAFFDTWERIRSGQALIVVATRQGLFAPFHNLGAVIVSEEQDESYKQWDMSPRYHGKRVAALLTYSFNANLIFQSNTPSTESIQRIKEKNMCLLSSLVSHPPIGSALTIVNLKLERYHKNFSPLSLALTDALRETLGQGNQALLYINRQGMNAFSVCDQCKNVFRCQKCSHPLTSTKEGHFRCASCGFMTALFPNCPTCGHLAFRHIGFGTEKVEKEVLKFFPRARVLRLDSTTLKTEKILQETYTRGMVKDIDILIGTQMILKDPPLPSLALVAMIDADSLLLFPDFQADERLFQNLSRAVRQVAKESNGVALPGKVFVQTFHPESAFFQRIAVAGSKTFLEQTLLERKELFYPPFSRLISLICQGKNEEEAIKMAGLLYKDLQTILPQGYRLKPPHPPRYLKKQSLFESTLLLRFPSDSTLTEAVSKYLTTKSKHCLIDVDPLSLQ